MNNKIKLYIFHPYSRIGGADKSISRLIDNLGPEYDINFICLGQNNLSISKKITIVKIKSSRTIFAIGKIRKFLKSDKNKNYKKYIFLSNQNFANIASFLILFNLKWIKQILVERNHLDEFKYKKSFKNYFIKFLIKILYKKADQVIGISQKLSRDLSVFSNSKVKTIYNPSFDKQIYKFTKKKPFPLYGSKKIILNVARLDQQKDHITLLKAFNIVQEKFDVFLVIIGYGSEKKKIVQFIRKNNLEKKVKILENISSPYNYFANSDLFVLTSIYEGFGNVLVEAAMFDLPIVSTNCNAGPKEILLNGKGGYLVKTKDHKQLAKRISFIFRNKKIIKKKIKILKFSLKRFSLKKNINEFDKIFKEI